MTHRQRAERRFAAMMVLPASLVLLAVTIFPLLYSLAISFTNFQLSSRGQVHFIGLGNYLAAMTDGRFWGDMANTGILMALGLTVQLLLGFIIALLLQRITVLRGVFVPLFLIPTIISPIVGGWMWRMILSYNYGPLNYVLHAVFGIAGPAWRGDPHISLLAIFLVDTWEWTPFMAVIIFSALRSIPPELIDAASVDGASGWSLVRYISVPLITPVLGVGILIRGMDIFKIFDIIYILTGGGPGSSSESIGIYNYIVGFQSFSTSYASALSFIQLIVVGILATLLIRYIETVGGQQEARA